MPQQIVLWFRVRPFVPFAYALQRHVGRGCVLNGCVLLPHVLRSDSHAAFVRVELRRVNEPSPTTAQHTAVTLTFDCEKHSVCYVSTMFCMCCRV